MMRKKSQDWLIPRCVHKERDNRSPQRVCKYFCLILSRYVRAKHRDSGASVVNEARMSASSEKTQKGETRNTFEDKRKSQEIT